MKWFYLLFFVSIIQIQGNTQVLSFVSGDTLIKYFDVDDYTPAHTQISNLIDSSVIFHWEIITFDHPIGWEFSFCDYPMCYTGGEMEGTMDAVSPLSNEAFITLNVEATYADTGFYQIMVWNENHLSATDTLTAIMIAIPNFSALPHLREETTPLSLYPNPSVSMIHFSEQNFDYSVYDLSGKMIDQGTCFAGELSIESLAPGMYLIKVKLQDGIEEMCYFEKIGA